MTQRRTTFRYEDLRHMPEDGNRWEVLDGDLVCEPPPRPLHQVIVSNLLGILLPFVQGNNLGLVLTSPLGVVMSEENVVQPDVVFIPAGRLGILGEEEIRGAPALAVEVLSPSTRVRDCTVKVKIYERFAVEEYWTADPWRRRIDRYVLSQGKYAGPTALTMEDTLVSPLFPGLAIEVRQVFTHPLVY